MPAVPAMATEAEAAFDVAVMVAASPATRVIAPVVVVTVLSAFVIAASMSLATVLRASATPMDNASAPVPANDAANEAAPAFAVMVEVS